MTADSKLLRAYAFQRDQVALADLVRRHIDFVYTVALRRLGGRSGMAQDVCQEVFLVLARKAEDLVHHPALKAWLFRTARLCAGRAETADRRRRNRELEAQAMIDMHAAQPEDEAWAKLRPTLDEALEQLSESDRQVVILRFFEVIHMWK